MYEVEAIEKSEHRRRMSVKPGITCTWQASGRNQITEFRGLGEAGSRIHRQLVVVAGFQDPADDIAGGDVQEGGEVTDTIPMPSAIFIVLALVLACLFGSNTDEWSWGPSILAVAGGLLALTATPRAARRWTRIPGFFWFSFLAAAAYLGWRAWVSPVRELAVADLMLLAACGGVFLVAALMGRDRPFLRVTVVGLGLLLVLNAGVALLQLRDPGFNLLPIPRVGSRPSGLFPHYNYFSNFQIGGGLLLAGMAVLNRGHSRWLRAGLGVAGVLALSSVPLSLSRGGVIGLGVGVVVLLLLLAATMVRRKGRFATLLLLLSPILVVVLTVASIRLLDQVQGARQSGTGLHQMVGQAGRLQYAQVGLKCFADHPWLGGGSRSLSWENYRFWDREIHGSVSADLVFAHNESVQLLTDYGIVGLLLVLVAVLAPLSVGVARLLTVEDDPAAPVAGSVAGAVAGLVRMLVQAHFSFVFHLAPSCLLLGLLLGLLVNACGRPADRDSKPVPAAWLFRLAALALAAVLVWPGVLSSRALYQLATADRMATTPAEAAVKRALAYEQACSLWASPALFLSQGRAWFEAAQIEESAELRRELFAKSADACAVAARLHPLDPQIAANHAQALSWLERNGDAEAEFRRAQDLQQGLESAFRIRYVHSRHLYRKGWKLVQEEKLPAAAACLEEAATLLDEAFGLTPAYVMGIEGREFRIQLSNTLAGIYLRLGRDDDALAEWQRAAAIPTGGRFKYHVAWEMRRRGEKAWLERQPEVALRWYTDAQANLRQTGGLVPEGITKEDVDALRAQIEDRIKLLKTAGIQLPPAAE